MRQQPERSAFHGKVPGKAPRRPDHDGTAILPLDRLHIVYDESQGRIVLEDAGGVSHVAELSFEIGFRGR
jgi:hypothetical protein